jgi:hypothetical protein
MRVSLPALASRSLILASRSLLALSFAEDSYVASVGFSETDAFELDRWQKGGIRSFEETCFSEYWDDVPLLVEQNAAVDPFNFLHRMALGKYLIEHTGGPEVWGPRYEKHWFWAYIAQMDWQWRSGRFEPPGVIGELYDKHPVTIDTDSWWAYMNMGFVVGLYCGAAKAGKVPPIRLATTLSDDANFQAIVDNWCAFFEGPHAEYIARKVDLSQDPYAVYSLYDQLWGFHSTTITYGLLGAKHLEKLLPPDDLKVGLGWCKMVELLDAMGWPHLSLESLMKDGAGYLPTLRLDAASTGKGSRSSLEYLKEHRHKEYVVCHSLFSLYETPKEKLQPMAKFWKRVSRYNSIRSNLPKMLDQLTHGSPIPKSLILPKLVGLAVIPQTTAEYAGWFSFIALLGAIWRSTLCR